MTDEETKRILSKNLKHYIHKSGKQQKDVAKAIDVTVTSLNNWVQGLALPRMGKIQKLADYFHINMSDLIEHTYDETQGEYYLDPVTAKKAQELFTNTDMRMLFDAAKDSKPEDLQMAADLLLRLKGTNPDG